MVVEAGHRHQYRSLVTSAHKVIMMVKVKLTMVVEGAPGPGHKHQGRSLVTRVHTR